MSKQTTLNKVRVFIGAQIRGISSNLLLRWIFFRSSQPIAVSKKSAIVFSPHQDDETLGCGGTIALKSAMNVPVMVVFITDGRYGKPEWIKSEDIIDIRKQEAQDALSILGVAKSDIKFLEQTDGSLQQFSDEQRQELIQNIVQILKSFMPEEVYVTHGQDRLTDHEATYKLVEEAIARSGIQVDILQYPIWMFWQNPLSFNLKLKEIGKAYRLPIHSVQDKKRKAILTYQSQIPGLTRSFLGRFFLPYEIFFK